MKKSDNSNGTHGDRRTSHDVIRLRGVRQNNLRNIDLDITGLLENRTANGVLLMRVCLTLCTVLAVFMSLMLASADAATVAHYRFEGTDTDVIDSESGTAHGTLNGAAARVLASADEANVPVVDVFADGTRLINEKSLSITGDGSAFMVGVPFQLHQGGSVDATVEFFLKAPNTNEASSILWTRSGADDQNRYNIHLTGTALAGDYRERSDAPEDPGTLHAIFSAGMTLVPNNWTHIAIVRSDVGGGAHEYRTYLNYVLQRCVTTIDLNAHPPDALEWGISGREGFDAEFFIDEVRFSDAALAAGDFLQVAGPLVPDCPGGDCNRYNIFVDSGVVGGDYREPFDLMPDPPHAIGGGLALFPDEWVHVAIVRTALGTDHEYQWYLNGVLQEGLTGFDVNAALPDFAAWTIGGRLGFPVQGRIDEIRMTNATLEPDSFLAVGANTAPQLIPDVVGYLRFEEGSGDSPVAGATAQVASTPISRTTFPVRRFLAWRIPDLWISPRAGRRSRICLSFSTEEAPAAMPRLSGSW